MGLLITGGSGYVGSHLKAALDQKKIDYLAPSHHEFDIPDYNSVKSYFDKNDVTEVIHLAAALDNDPAALFKTNIEGLYNLLKVSLEHKLEHLIFSSGNNIYGNMKNLPFKESDKSDPMINNSYGLSKYCGELVVNDILSNTGITYSILRIGDIYGPEQKTGNLVKAIVKNTKEAMPQKLYGLGVRTRDYIYIDDVVNGIIFTYEHRLNGTFNLATGVGTTVKELVAIAESISKCQAPTINVPVENEDLSKVILNIDKMKAAGFVPTVSIEDGLKRIINGGNY